MFVVCVLLIIFVCGGCAVNNPSVISFTLADDLQAEANRLYANVYNSELDAVVFRIDGAPVLGVTYYSNQIPTLLNFNKSLQCLYVKDRSIFYNKNGKLKSLIGVSKIVSPYSDNCDVPIHCLSVLSHELVHVYLYYKTGRPAYSGLPISTNSVLASLFYHIENFKHHGPGFQLEALLFALKTGIPILPILHRGTHEKEKKIFVLSRRRNIRLLEC